MLRANVTKKIFPEESSSPTSGQ